MKNRKTVEKVGVVLLAGLCVFLVFRLVSEIMGSPATEAHPETKSYLAPPHQAKPHAQKSSASAEPASALDMQSEMQSLDQYRPRPLPDLNRNPFDFGPPPLTPAQKAARAAQGIHGAMTASSAPAAPNMPLRAIGYQDRIGVGPEAYLVDSDDVFVVHDGDVVSKRFKILKITSMIVEVQDGTSGDKAQLPIPVVQ